MTLRFLGTLVACCIALPVSAQQGEAPLPQEAVSFVVDRFSDTPLVAIGETHGVQEVYDFYHALISNIRFQETVNDIVIEFGNARYQDILDRYIDGEPISLKQLRPLWRDHTNSLIAGGDDPLLLGLLQTIRDVNRELSLDQRLRVLAGDPPVDWKAVHSGKDFWPYLGRRDRHYARVVWDEILDKGRKALLIMGRAHFKRVDPSPPNYLPLLDLLEARQSEATYVIHVWKAPKDRVDWQANVIAPIANTWIGNLRLEDDAPDLKLEDQIDAVLYVGPTQTWTTVAATPYDPMHLAELSRRSWLVQGKPYRMLLYGALEQWIQDEGIAAARQHVRAQYAATPPLYDFGVWQFDLLGHELLQAERLDEAVAVFQLGLELHPNAAQTHTNLANAFALQGNLQQARAHYEQALQLDPNHTAAQDGLDRLKQN